MSELLRAALVVAGTATLAAVVLGLPLAWLLGRRSFPGKSVLEGVIILPLILPATLLGYYAVVLGRQGIVAAVYARLGYTPVFGWRLAVATAALGAMAMFVRVAQVDFARVDRRLEQAARTLGRSELGLFWSITLPLAWRGIVAGIMLAFCRAVGEFTLTLLLSQAGAAGRFVAYIPRDQVTKFGPPLLVGVLVLSLVASRLTRRVG